MGKVSIRAAADYPVSAADVRHWYETVGEKWMTGGCDISADDGFIRRHAGEAGIPGVSCLDLTSLSPEIRPPPG
jgi:hypothetical protein